MSRRKRQRRDKREPWNDEPQLSIRGSVSMAYADYRLCDVCNGKAFYDANLNYECEPGVYRYRPPYRIAGKPQYEDPAINEKHGMCLDYVGDWAVLCSDCAKTHRTQIVPIDFKSTP